MELTVSTENWTGNKITISINEKDRSFPYAGGLIRLAVEEDHHRDATYPMVIYSVMFCDTVGACEPLSLGYVIHDIAWEGHPEGFEAYEGDIAEGLRREGTCIFSAAIKLLHNIF